VTRLTCDANANLCAEIGESLLNLVAGHRDRGSLGRSLCRCVIGASGPGFEQVLESAPLQEMSTFEADGAVEGRGGALHRVAKGRKEVVGRSLGNDRGNLRRKTEGGGW
jgi:hypothetical protein